MKNQIERVLSTELDSNTLKAAMEYLESELESDSFALELKGYLANIDNSVDFERDCMIIKLIMLGMGRNRTIQVLEEYNLTRTIFEKVRDKSCVLNSNRIKENERAITTLRWESKTRARRLKKVEHIDWEELKNKYEGGDSVVSLSSEYNIKIHLIKELLIDEGLYDESRSTLTKKAVAKERYNEIDDNYIIQLSENNPLEGKYALWELAKEEYPWLLRRQMFSKLTSLGLDRTEEEINMIRRVKSKTETNESYMVKVNGYKACREVYGSVSELAKQYSSNKLGSFNKIANNINEKIDFDYIITPKQVSKIITKDPAYVRKESLGQKQLFEFIKSVFTDSQVVDEYEYSETTSKLDVYIPELKIGFEFNGDYWHSDEVIQYNYGMTAYDFHADRVNRAKSLGINLMYVWEDDWNKNFVEVEDAISNSAWDAQILNKYESTSSRNNYWAPDRQPSLLRKQIERFLKDNKIDYEKKNNSHLITLLDHNLIINVPNYKALSNESETLELQKEYEEIGIEFLTFLPWRNIYKIKEFLSYRLKLNSVSRIAARKCKLNTTKGITKEQRLFFEKNHLLGYNNFRHIDKTVTLEYNSEVVIAALFIRKPNSNIVELKRLVSKYGIAVQGGASRLLKEYTRQTPDIEEIFTFSDADLGFGGVYDVLGFDLIERSKQQLTWYNESLDMKFSNLSLLQVGADRLLRNIPEYEMVGVGEGLPSNQEIVQQYGFIPIYDSGYKKWTMKLKEEVK